MGQTTEQEFVHKVSLIQLISLYKKLSKVMEFTGEACQWRRNKEAKVPAFQDFIEYYFSYYENVGISVMFLEEETSWLN